MAASYRSDAWQLVGLSQTVRGRLALSGGRLRFSTLDGTVFDAPLTSVSHVASPWYYFGGGMTLRVHGTPYRFSFVRPVHELGDMGDIPAGRAAGKAWRRVLGGVDP